MKKNFNNRDGTKVDKPMIALAGTAADYPHWAHKQFLQILTGSGIFKEVIWVVSGDRPDKPNLAPANLRAQMSEALLADMLGEGSIRLDLEDTKKSSARFRTTSELIDEYEAKYRDYEIVIATGLDLLIPHGGKCEIEATWHNGPELIKRPIAAVVRPGYKLENEGDLPYNVFIIEGETDKISSSEGKRMIEEGLPWEHTTHPGVVAIIKKHNLYGFKA